MNFSLTTSASFVLLLFNQTGLIKTRCFIQNFTKLYPKFLNLRPLFCCANIVNISQLVQNTSTLILLLITRRVTGMIPPGGDTYNCQLQANLDRGSVPYLVGVGRNPSNIQEHLHSWSQLCSANFHIHTAAHFVHAHKFFFMCMCDYVRIHIVVKTAFTPRTTPACLAWNAVGVTGAGGYYARGNQGLRERKTERESGDINGGIKWGWQQKMATCSNMVLMDLFTVCEGQKRRERAGEWQFRHHSLRSGLLPHEAHVM